MLKVLSTIELRPDGINFQGIGHCSIVRVLTINARRTSLIKSQFSGSYTFNKIESDPSSKWVWSDTGSGAGQVS